MTIAPLFLLLSFSTGSLSQGESAGGSATFALLSHEELTEGMHALGRSHPDLVTILTLGASREERSIEALRITAGEPDHARPAILLVANLEGPRPFSSSVALRVAQRLVVSYATDPDVKRFLDTTTVYVVPRANPDAAEAFFRIPRIERVAGGRAVDRDRDGYVGEDAPADLNGDGMITQIRVRDPEGDWIPDPADPRVMIEADPELGQRGEWKVLPEGLDDDGDGEIAEDGAHDTVLNRSFPAGWEQHAPDAGLFPGDEPEARALMDFVIGHRDLALVVTYDGLDNLVEAPESVEDDAPPVTRIPRPGILESDAKILERIGETYRESTGSTATGASGDEGSFQRWCYDHRGLFTLNIVPWRIPDEPDSEGAVEDEAEEVEAPAVEPSADAKRLAWMDASGETWRFVPWTPFDHPTLGAVEIGGFAPHARTVPPLAERVALADAQYAFFVGLGELLPRPAIASFTREDLGGGVWKVEAVIENRAMLPLQSRAALRARTIRPARLRLELPSSEMMLSGSIQELLSDLGGAGGRRTYDWLVRAPGDVPIALSVDTDNAGAARRTAEVVQ